MRVYGLCNVRIEWGDNRRGQEQTGNEPKYILGHDISKAFNFERWKSNMFRAKIPQVPSSEQLSYNNYFLHCKTSHKD